MFITLEHCALSDPFWSTSRRALPSLQLTTVSLAPVDRAWSCCGGSGWAAGVPRGWWVASWWGGRFGPAVSPSARRCQSLFQ